MEVLLKALFDQKTNKFFKSAAKQHF